MNNQASGLELFYFAVAFLFNANCYALNSFLFITFPHNDTYGMINFHFGMNKIVITYLNKNEAKHIHIHSNQRIIHLKMITTYSGTQCDPEEKNWRKGSYNEDNNWMCFTSYSSNVVFLGDYIDDSITTELARHRKAQNHISKKFISVRLNILFDINKVYLIKLSNSVYIWLYSIMNIIQ